MGSLPLVSILVPNYNKGKYLSEALNSILCQEYSNWECIIVDDHSIDESWEILEIFAKSDSRFRIFKRPDFLEKGGNICRNYAISQSRGQYLFFLDSDDVLATFSLSQRIDTIQNYPKFDFWAFSTVLFEMNITDSKYFWNLPNGNESVLSRFLRMDALWQTSGCIYDRGFLIDLNGLNSRRKIWQDYELHLKALLTSNSFKIEFNLKPDVFIRNGDPTSLSRSTPFSGDFEILNERISFLEEIYSFAIEKRKVLTNSEQYSLFSLQYFLILQLWLKHGDFKLFSKKWFKYSNLYSQSRLFLIYGFIQALFLKANNRLKFRMNNRSRIFKKFPDYYILEKVQIGKYPIS